MSRWIVLRPPCFSGHIRSAFLDHWSSSALVFPRAGLSSVFVDPACAFIERHGGMVRCAADVVSLQAGGGAVSGVILKGGEQRFLRRGYSRRAPRHGWLISGRSNIPLSREHRRDGSGGGFTDYLHPPLVRAPVHGPGCARFDRPARTLDLPERASSSLQRSAPHMLWLGLSNEELVNITVEDLRTVFGGSGRDCLCMRWFSVRNGPRFPPRRRTKDAVRARSRRRKISSLPETGRIRVFRRRSKERFRAVKRAPG